MLHPSMVAYIAGTARDEGLSLKDAAFRVWAEFALDPAATTENADMLNGFAPEKLTGDDYGRIELCYLKLREMDRILAAMAS